MELCTARGSATKREPGGSRATYVPDNYAETTFFRSTVRNGLDFAAALIAVVFGVYYLFLFASFKRDKSLLKSHRLTLVIHGGQDNTNHYSVYVSVDSIRLEQVISNLISNAVKYSPHGSKIVLGLQLTSVTDGQTSTANIFVANQGTVIPAED